MRQTTLLLLATLLMAAGCRHNKTWQGPKDIVFLESVHDLGRLSPENPTDSFDFRFVNHTGAAIVVLGTKTSCPCTKATYPHVPVMEGDTSYIRVIFDGRGRGPERFSKTISVTTSNAQDDYLLEIKGETP